MASRTVLIDEHKAPQGAYAVFAGQKQHGDADVLRAQQLIESTAGHGFSLEHIAEQVAMSRRTFIRRFKAATGETPRTYLQRSRIEAAKRALEQTRGSVLEVALEVGCEDITAFRRILLRHTRLTPSDYRRRHGNRVSAANRNKQTTRAPVNHREVARQLQLHVAARHLWRSPRR